MSSFARSTFHHCLDVHFTRDGVRIALPIRWIAEYHEIASNARLLGRILAEAHHGKPRILTKWERELGA